MYKIKLRRLFVAFKMVFELIHFKNSFQRGDTEDKGRRSEPEDTSEDEGSEAEDEAAKAVSAAAALLDPALDEYRSGRYSPAYLAPDDLELGSIVISEAEDASKIKIDQVHKSSALEASEADDLMAVVVNSLVLQHTFEC
jgi:hypothetical protein